MSKRRSLDDALSPEEEAFLSDGKPPSAELEQASPVLPSTPNSEPPPSQESTNDQRYPNSQSLPKRNGVFALHIRIDADLHQALTRVMYERKLSGQEPSSKRDIVSISLRDWLERNS